MRDKKVKVIVGEPTGFCSGVKRAIAIVKKEAKKANGATAVYTLGPIVHNAEVVNELNRLGIKTIKTEQFRRQNSKKPVVVIRSHGCAPAVVSEINKLGYRVIDATCPYVRRVQNHASQLKDDGYFTIVVGDKNHPEVKGIIGRAQPLAKVYHINSIPNITRNSPFATKIGIIGQTTIPFERFQGAINSFHMRDYEEIRIFNTLCKESLNRQKTCKKIADKVDLLIVVGSRNSANTSSLVDIARKRRAKVYQVEDKSELQRKWFKALQRIGVIAGASTPQSTVFDVVNQIKKFSNRGYYSHG